MCFFSVFKNLTITPGQFVENTANIRKFVRQMNLKDFLKPGLEDSLSELYRLPNIAKVSAAYAKVTNTITVPLQVIQPPFFWSNLQSLAFGSLGYMAGMILLLFT